MDASGLHATAEESSPQPTVTQQLCQGVAHDLRGVLMAIQLSAEELTTPGAPVVELQTEIQGSIERATRLVSELTALAHPTGGHSESFDVGPVIEQMQRMLRRNARSGTRVELELTRDPCFVAAPRMVFKLVLLSLFNGIAARLPPKGKLALTTAVVHEAPAGDPMSARARVVVSLGDGSSHADDWAAATLIPTASVSHPGAEELLSLVQRLDAELYCLGPLETSWHFWLSLPRANASPGAR